MDDQRSHDSDKFDEVMLPGFRFHPTDEELVGFYLERKIQHRPLSIELIKQLDIYKFDPWDLPKMASGTGEKEWYFYCPRDRKYRNSSRPNRVTRAGFWKATGTDRPIYSSEGTSKCIGLKKSLVFYKGRAARGIKTNWMMHEFRLPSLTDSLPSKRFLDKNNIPANDSWAICRIFKKANSNAQRAVLSNSWESPVLPTTTTTVTSEMLTPHYQNIVTPPCNNNLQHSSVTSSLTPNFDLPPYKPYNQTSSALGYTFSSQETPDHHQLTKCNIDTSSLLFNMSYSSLLGDFNKVSEGLDYNAGTQDQYANNGFVFALPQIQENVGHGGESTVALMNVNCPNIASLDDDIWGINVRSSIGFPYILPMSVAETWTSSLLCESSPSPSDQMSTGYSTTLKN